jgi:hypothetical protein
MNIHTQFVLEGFAIILTIPSQTFQHHSARRVEKHPLACAAKGIAFGPCDWHKQQSLFPDFPRHLAKRGKFPAKTQAGFGYPIGAQIHLSDARILLGVISAINTSRSRNQASFRRRQSAERSAHGSSGIAQPMPPVQIPAPMLFLADDLFSLGGKNKISSTTNPMKIEFKQTLL